MDIELSSEEFELFRRFIYQQVGISLSDQKTTLIKSRLNKRLRELKLNSFHQYYDYLYHDQSGEELTAFINAISTNVTSFFRESAQWAWLKNNLSHVVNQKEKKIRIWSAGCSTGEEPYTILMFLQHSLPDFERWDIKILATDISMKALSKASEGLYPEQSILSLPKDILHQSFTKQVTGTGTYYQIKPHLREKILFRSFNLVTDPFILKNRFDIIFCRNVMIYFDEATRNDVIRKFSTLLAKDSPLFLGSSESLTSQKDLFRLIGSSIYARL